MRNNMKNMLPPLPTLVGCAAFAFLLIAPGTVQAQAQPKQFFACYVPSSGVIYRIKAPGLKDECTGKKHVEFSWAELYAASDGKVGIGTSDPTAALDVAGDIHASGVLKLGNTMTLDGVANTITTDTDEDMAILPGGTGKVGIGTTTPSTTLEVNGTVTATAYLGDGSGLTNLPAGGAGDGHSLDAADGSPADALFVDNDGNVGIGTTSPSTKLEVNGIVTANSFIGDGSGLTNLPSGVSDHGLLSGLAVDDHTQYLLADGVRNTTNGFVVTGTESSGVIPTSGEGTRIMWYPRKAAFRVGQVTGDRWDDANIGLRSIAMGRNTMASGIGSTAMGASTTASGTASTAMGVSTTASGGGSTAMGWGTEARGDGSTAMGSGTEANGEFSTAMGKVTIASGASSFAAGFHARANHDGTFVWADRPSPSGDFLSTAVNQFLIRASGGVGIGTNDPGEQLTVAGTIESTLGGFKFPDGTVQTTAGGGAGGDGHSLDAADGSLTDALFVDNGGNVGIGTATPASKLEVKDGNIRVTGGSFIDDGETAITGYEVLTESGTVPAGAGLTQIILDCPTGKKVLGGGAEISTAATTGANPVRIIQSIIDATSTSWLAMVRQGASAATLYVRVTCARID